MEGWKIEIGRLEEEYWLRDQFHPSTLPVLLSVGGEENGKNSRVF